MSTPHKRYFPILTHAQLEALTRLCGLRQPVTKRVLKLYAIDGLTPQEITAQTGVAYTNVSRTLTKAKAYRADAHAVCGLQ